MNKRDEFLEVLRKTLLDQKTLIDTGEVSDFGMNERAIMLGLLACMETNTVPASAHTMEDVADTFEQTLVNSAQSFIYGVQFPTLELLAAFLKEKSERQSAEWEERMEEARREIEEKSK